MESTGPMSSGSVAPTKQSSFGLEVDEPAVQEQDQHRSLAPSPPHSPLDSLLNSPSFSSLQSLSQSPVQPDQLHRSHQSQLPVLPPSRLYTMTLPSLTSIQLPSSPTRSRVSPSPRLVSPACSQIFERDVQDSCLVLPPSSPAIPSHIKTENHIPSVLDASSQAITDDHLDLERVEIITHPSHMPAAFTLAVPPDPAFGLTSWVCGPNLSDILSHSVPLDREDTSSTFGPLDSADVRRLSFISFADVVQSEHGSTVGSTGGAGAGNHESFYLGGLNSLSYRSTSPISSPALGTSSPISSPTSIKGFDLSPDRKVASPLLSGTNSLSPMLPVQQFATVASPSVELNVETMSQALRRTGSGDLTGARTIPLSPIEGPLHRS